MSRRHPQFGRDSLQAALASAQIEYTWLESLGGRRYPRPDSPNTGWRVTGFRGYADYMETPEFQHAFDGLLDIAAEKRTAIMCAEALWWQCHRRLVSDAVVARGHDVLHIQTPAVAAPHKLIPPAHLRDGKLSYVAAQPELDF